MWLLQVFFIIFPQAGLVCASLDYVLFAGMTTAFLCLFECFLPAPAGSLRGRGLLAMACRACAPSPGAELL